MRLRKTVLTVLISIAFLFYPVLLSFFPPTARPLLFAQTPSAKKSDAPFITLPATKTVKPDKTFYLVPKTNCTTISWDIPDGLEQDTEIQLKDKFAIALSGSLPAGQTSVVYTVQAYGALGDQAALAKCVVTIGTPTPPPPPPPPVPPAPSALTAALQAGYNLDTDADKATSLEFLQSAYAGMAALAKPGPSQDAAWAALKTVADASAKIQSVVEAPGVGLSLSQVKNLRTAIQTEMVKVFGSTATAPIDLTALSTELSTIATALKGVK